MPHFICTTCGTQFSASDAPPDACSICQDERQYVKPTGQQWTTLDRLRISNRISLRQYEPGLIGIGIDPQFAIGQRALLLRTPAGNILWDCIPLIDDAIVEVIRALGGLAAIAISHPHYYSSMVDWSQAFDRIPIYLHSADRQWVMRADDSIHFWDGDTLPLFDGLTLVRCGGHFDGGTILHSPASSSGHGALFTGDIIQVVADRQHVSFMYSYPNFIPLSSSSIHRVLSSISPFSFSSIYGAFWDSVILNNAPTVLHQSATRYLKHLSAI
jgi:hypothetical protein